MYINVLVFTLLQFFIGFPGKDTGNLNLNDYSMTADSTKLETLWHKADSLENIKHYEELSKLLHKIHEVAVSKGLIDHEILSEYKLAFIQEHKTHSVDWETLIENYRENVAEEKGIRLAFNRLILAQLYLNYARRYRFRKVDDDIVRNTAGSYKDWSLGELQNEAFRLYRKALEEPSLKKTSLSEVSKLVSPWKNIGFSPTLYDLVAQNFITDFQSSFNAITSVSSNPLYSSEQLFAERQEFLAMNIPADTSDTDTYMLHFMQEYLRYLQDKDAELALARTEVARLEYAKKASQNADKESLFFHALRRLSRENFSGKAQVYILSQFIKNYSSEYDLAQYKNDPHAIDSLYGTHRDYYDRIIEEYRGEELGAFAEAEKKQEAKASLSIDLEAQYGYEQGFLVKLNYKNVDKLSFTTYRLPNTIDNHREFRSGDIKDYIGRGEKVYKLEEDLPLIPSYRSHTAELILPGMDYGLYLVAAEAQSIYGKPELRSYALVQVSDMNALVIGEGKLRVLNRSDGLPVSDAEVTIHQISYNDNDRIFRKTSDKAGIVNFPYGRHDGYRAHIQDGEDIYITERYWISHYERPLNERIQIHIFTDRSIYRPGQMVYFKAIASRGIDENTHIVSDKQLTFTLFNLNGEKVSSVHLTTDDYGAVTGSFALPSVGLPGTYTIRTAHNDGFQSIQVEEYKRPKFQVTINKPSSKLTLGESTIIHGTAEAYAGYPIASANVHITVTRKEYRIPYCYYWFPPLDDGGKRILDTLIRTDNAGKYSQKIQFDASELEIEQDRSFLYEIRVTVSDQAGETHSKEMRLIVGTKALMIDVKGFSQRSLENADQSFTIQAQNSAGKGVATSGKFVLTELIPPEEIYMERYWELPDTILATRDKFQGEFPFLSFGKSYNPLHWKEGKEVKSASIHVPEGGKEMDFNDLKPGIYKLELTLKDAVSRSLVFSVLDYDNPFIHADELDVVLNKETYKPGEKVEVKVLRPQEWQIYAIIYDKNANVLMAETVEAGESGFFMTLPDEEGDVRVLLYTLQHGRVRSSSQNISVVNPAHNYHIEVVKIDSIVKPGASLKWTFRLVDGNGNPVRAAGLATLYDSSLDALKMHKWKAQLRYSYVDRLRFQNVNKRLASVYTDYDNTTYGGAMIWQFPSLSPILDSHLVGLYQNYRMGGIVEMHSMRPGAVDRRMVQDEDRELVYEKAISTEGVEGAEGEKEDRTEEIRENLSELVLFDGSIRTDENGEFTLDFTMNEALTEWKLMLMTYDKQLYTASLTESVITQKNLMVQEQFPRFFREGDNMLLAATIIRTDGIEGKGSVSLHFTDAITGENVDSLFKLQPIEEFTIGSSGQTVVKWAIEIPGVDKVPAVKYVLSVEMGDKSDAVTSSLPLVTNRKFITETVPLFTPAESTRTYAFEDYAEKTASQSLESFAFQLEYVPNPVWEAIKAMPAALSDDKIITSLMQNYMIRGLAMKIVDENPQIKAVYKQWQGDGDLQSNLSKNTQLKMDKLSETPWVQAARSQTDRMRRIAHLFHLEMLVQEQKASLQRLNRAQRSDGSWPWIEGGKYSSWYVTMMVLDYFADLNRMRGSAFTVDEEKVIHPAIEFIDAEFIEYWNKYLKGELQEDRRLSTMPIQYLRIRMQYDVKLPEDNASALAQIVDKLHKEWMEYPLPTMVYIGLALRNYDESIDIKSLLESVDQQLVKHEEMGAYFKGSFYYGFYAQSIPLTVAMMELFDPVKVYEPLVRQLKLFLLSNKRTNDWGQSSASMKAIYALLYYGNPIELNTERQVDIIWGGEPVSVKDSEVGTGTFSLRKSGSELNDNNYETVTIENHSDHASWGGLYWQYFEDMDAVQAGGISKEFPLSIDKNFYREVKTADGTILKAIEEGDVIDIGDEITVQINIRVDRSMDFIHVKDDRPAGTEPVDVISGFEFSSGLSYYQATRDLSSDFYMSSIAPGQYSIEYKIVASHAGTFSAGLAVAQSYYAPEMSSHSEGRVLIIKK